MKIQQNDRISIDEILQSNFFDSVRDLKRSPALDDDHQKLKVIAQDFINRGLSGNVHKFSGRAEFD